ncbi:protein VACUOLELESS GAMETOPHYTES-like [Henckelia pumila]|uniref:protein VACUOLELESS GAMETOPHYTES-like n=1 Tax=Henckelia pumila TaxID=405737 RepID=UPI003C6DC727
MGNPNLEQSDQTAPVLTHFSHPHPLKLSNAAASHCSACKVLDASGAAAVYSCTVCSFSLHKKCYDLPQKIKHEFDQAHVLSLQPKPVYPEGVFKCDACGIQGDGFSYHCSPCGTDLHSICASLPMTLSHNCHQQHYLSLTFSAPYAGNAFSCDICKRVGSKTWLYRCNLCEFDVHLTCVAMIPTSTPHNHPQNLPRSISEPSNIYPSPSLPTYHARPPHHSASLGHPYPAQPYPAPVPYNNFNQPQGGVRPANGLGNLLLGNVANGIASGVAQATAQAVIQGFTSGGGGGAGGGAGVVNHSSQDAGTTDGSYYVDGGYGGTDVGYQDVSYY